MTSATIMTRNSDGSHLTEVQTADFSSQQIQAPPNLDCPLSLHIQFVLKPPTALPSAFPQSASPERMFIPYFTNAIQPPELHEKIVQEMSKDVTKSDKAGFVYILKDHLSPGYSKIGHTATTVGKRVADQGYKCGFDPGIENDPYQRDTVLRLKLERLVHTEFAACRMKEVLCRRGKGCNVKTHVEWFQIDGQTAVEAVERWRKWLELGVYVKGKLDQTWVDKIELLVYVEGQSWEDTWIEWMSLVLNTEKGTRQN